MKPCHFCKSILDDISSGIYVIDSNLYVRYWNRIMERITSIKSTDILGQNCENKKFLYYDRSGGHPCNHEECVLVNAIKYGISNQQEFYLRHKDGFQIPVSIRAMPLKNIHDKVVGAAAIPCIDLYRLAGIRYATEQELMGYIDPLTGIGNRRYMEMNVQRRLEEMSRYLWNFGVLFIDLDHFKKINDSCGHNVGDEVLKNIATLLRYNLRPYDGIGRWGGEEFIVALLGVDEDKIINVSNRLRRLIEKNKFITEGHDIKYTISIGATLGKSTDTVDSLITRADKLMYKSKKDGRNKVSFG